MSIAPRNSIQGRITQVLMKEVVQSLSEERQSQWGHDPAFGAIPSPHFLHGFNPIFCYLCAQER